MISRSFISQLVSQCDIEDVVSSYVTPKRAGRNLKAVCPFHSEKTPSFVIYPETQSYYCFGCGAGGDIISFIMQAERLDYIDAVRFLANRAGLRVPDDGDDEAARIKASVYQINKESARFFHSCLKSPAGTEGYDYLKNKRMLPDRVITAFGLGYAPNTWESLYNHLRSAGFSEKDMLASAVVTKGKNGKPYDAFRNRVMFPIIDLRGNVIGFGGRVLDDSKPKYLNSPDTPVFKKSNNLFSMNNAKNSINAKDSIVILAEGYMDVIAIYAAGIQNVVATLGTALTTEQARLIGKYAKEVTIAYDSDGPGQAATMRAINIFSDEGISCKVLHMEGAKDPDEFIKKFGVKRFEILLSGASDIIEHELGALRTQVDMKTSEGKISYCKKAISILSAIKNPLERDVYCAAVARECEISAEAVREQTSELIKRKYRVQEKKEWHDIELNKGMTRDKINPQKGQNVREAIAEERIISILFKNIDFVDYLLERLPFKDFITDFNRRVYEALYNLQAQRREINLTELSSIFSHEEISAISAILARNSAEPATKEMLDAYIDILCERKGKINPAKLNEVLIDDIEAYRQRLGKAKK